MCICALICIQLISQSSCSDLTNAPLELNFLTIYQKYQMPQTIFLTPIINPPRAQVSSIITTNYYHKDIARLALSYNILNCCLSAARGAKHVKYSYIISVQLFQTVVIAWARALHARVCTQVHTTSCALWLKCLLSHVYTFIEREQT